MIIYSFFVIFIVLGRDWKYYHHSR